MSSLLSKRGDDHSASVVKDDALLAYRIKELTAVLEEQDTVVADGCHVLRNASQSLASVRAKYEPLKEHASTLSATSANATAVNTDLHKLIASLKMHQKVGLLNHSKIAVLCTTYPPSM